MRDETWVDVSWTGGSNAASALSSLGMRWTDNNRSVKQLCPHSLGLGLCRASSSDIICTVLFVRL